MLADVIIFPVAALTYFADVIVSSVAAPTFFSGVIGFAETASTFFSDVICFLEAVSIFVAGVAMSNFNASVYPWSGLTRHTVSSLSSTCLMRRRTAGHVLDLSYLEPIAAVCSVRKPWFRYASDIYLMVCWRHHVSLAVTSNSFAVHGHREDKTRLRCPRMQNSPTMLACAAPRQS